MEPMQRDWCWAWVGHW